jgi:hypothetical protein
MNCDEVTPTRQNRIRHCGNHENSTDPDEVQAISSGRPVVSCIGRDIEKIARITGFCGEDGLDFVISFVRDIVDVEASLWMDLNLW